MFSINIWYLYINFDFNFRNKLPNMDFNNNYIFQNGSNIIQEILTLIKKRIIIPLKM